MEELFELFEQSEDIRHNNAIKSNPEFFEPTRGKNCYKVCHEQFLKKIEKHEFGKTTNTGENLDAVKKYDLTINEASTIYMYTHHQIYNDINYSLRNLDKQDGDVSEYVNMLNDALDKLPSHNNEIVYRDIRNPEGGFEKCLNFYNLKIGEEITFKEFLSCHTDDVRISDKENDFQFVIITKEKSNAKDIQEITFINLEKEVLFKTQSTFIIEKVSREENRVYIREI